MRNVYREFLPFTCLPRPDLRLASDIRALRAIKIESPPDSEKCARKSTSTQELPAVTAAIEPTTKDTTAVDNNTDDDTDSDDEEDNDNSRSALAALSPRLKRKATTGKRKPGTGKRKPETGAKASKPVPALKRKSTPVPVPTQPREPSPTPTPVPASTQLREPSVMPTPVAEPSRPKPTPPGYSRKALLERAAAEAAKKEAENELLERAAADRIASETASNAELEGLAATARQLATEVAQADLVASALASPSSRPLSPPVASQRPSDVALPGVSGDAFPRARRVITRTVAGTEIAKQKELSDARARKAADTKAQNKARRDAEDAAGESRPSKKARATKGSKQK